MVGGGPGRHGLGPMVPWAQRTRALGQFPLLSPPQIMYGHFSPNRLMLQEACRLTQL